MNGLIFKKQPGWRHLIVLLVYTLLTLLMTWPLAANLTTAIPGDSFDGWQNYWNLWWLKVALVERQTNPFVTDLLYHPTGVGLYFHTLNPFNGLITLPIQLSLGLIPAYNAVVFISWVLGGYGAYLLALWILRPKSEIERLEIEKRTGEIPYSGVPSGLRTLHSLAAFLAGLIFTFSPFHMAHLLGHMQVMALQWIPFYVLYLLRTMEESKNRKGWLRSALLAGLFLTLAGLCDWYFVLYLLLFTGLGVVWYLGYWVLGIGRRLPHLQSPISILAVPVVIGLFFFTLLAPILLPMLREATQFSFMIRPAADLYTFSASVMDFFVPNRLHTLFRPESFAWIGNQVAPPSERTISIGYLPLALALVAVWKDRKRVRFWLVCALFFLLLALGPRPHWGYITQADIPVDNEVIERWTPFALLNRLIPFMRISRSVSRYALMVQLSMAMAAAVGFVALSKTSASKPRSLSPALFVSLSALLVLLEFWVAPYPLSPPDTPAFYEQLRTQPDTGAVLNLPMNYDRPGYLLYQTVHQKPLTVGYISRDDPRTLTERVPVLQHLRHLGPDILEIDPVVVGMTVLNDLGVGLVVLDRYKMPGGVERTYTEQLATAIFAGQSPLFADERITVYQVQPPAEPLPYLALGALHWGLLQRTEDGRRWRSVGVEPAELQVYHGAGELTLRLRYHTPGQASLRVLAADGQQTLATLPPTSAGDSALINIGSAQTIRLMADAPDGVAVEGIELVLPPP